MVVDKFTGGGMRLKGYTGPQGTGNLLATATAPNSNYQRNNMVFMGVTDGGVNSIRSVVWNIPNNGGDVVGIDDIRFGATGIMNNRSFVQSKVLHDTWDAVGAAKITWYESKPQGTDIVYNLTVDGEHWVEMDNNTHHVFDHRAAQLMWNATLTTEDEEITPYIDKVIIEYDLVSDPEPKEPSSDEWQGTATPTLKWNFTDPDIGDHQSDFLVEIYRNGSMNETVYNSSWVNSTDPEHTVQEELDDGVYYWRARTKDSYHAASNYSVFKKLMIDVTKPRGNITIEEGASVTNEQLVDIRINATDNGSGIVDMQIIGDDGNPGPWEEYKTEKRIALELEDGPKTIGVIFRDMAGIMSDVFNDTIYLDLKGPGDVEVFSPTHPDTALYYNSTQPVFQWEPPHEVAGIKGYSYTVDSSPSTEPSRVLYTQNSEITGTYPGEFRDLSDGTWYFHITVCDVYDQWGNTSHFEFHIDTTVPVISDITPGEEEWFNTTSIRVGAVFQDQEGFGLDSGSIEYSIKLDNGDFSGWSSKGMEMDILQTGIQDNPVKVQVSLDIVVAEGIGNAIMWRVRDLAGNGPVLSERYSINVDISPVTFDEYIPEEDEIFTETGVSCGVTVSDGSGCGVDGKTIEYCISAWGDSQERFVNWTSISNNMIKPYITVLLEMEFEPGYDNYIKWRAMDGVGNGFSVSEPVRVRVNSPPVPVIHKPSDDARYLVEEAFELSAEGTYDNEEAQLSYYWKIQNKTTKKDMFKGSGMELNTTLDIPGKYVVYLYVDDGSGFNESVKIDILIIPEKTDPAEEEKPGETPISEVITKGGMDIRWWLLGIIAVVLIVLALVIIFVAVKRRRKKEANTVPSPVARQPHPYPRGQYPHGMNQRYAQPGYAQPPQAPRSYPAAPGGGPAQQRLMLPPGPGVPSTPPVGPTSQQLLPNAMPSGAPGAIPQLPGYQSTSPGTPSYSLPVFTTDEGTQELNRLALPAAPLDDTTFGSTHMAGTAMAGEPQPDNPLEQLLKMTIAGDEPITSTPGPQPLDLGGTAWIDQFGNLNSPADSPLPPVQPPTDPPDVSPSPEAGSPEVDMSAPGLEEPLSTPAPPISGPDVPVPGTGGTISSPAPPIPGQDIPVPENTPDAPASIVVQCHSCGDQYEVSDSTRPLIIECPVCHEKGYLAE